MQKFRAVNQIPTMVTNQTKNSADINIYGPIVDSAWFSDGCTTPQKIQNALASMGNVSQINVHINSPGGSVFAGQAIHNMLRQHPANVTVYVDGLAASIASIVAMAGNKIVMPPGAMMMIHNPLLNLWGAYQAGECREMADFLDKIKASLVATYTARQSKKTKDEIIALMDATTWLTADEAVNEGFADEIDGCNVAAALDGKVLNIAGMQFDLSSFSSMPTNLTQINPDKNPVNKNINEEATILDIKELQAKHPDLYGEIMNIGVTNERNRMKELDDVQIDGFEDIVNKARYETGATAEQVAVKIIAAQKQQGAEYLKNRQKDIDASNVDKVPPAKAPDTKATEEKEAQDLAKKIADAFNQGRA